MSRIRTNLITNRMANGAPTVSHGLVISGVTTVTTLDLNGDLDVDGHLNADNVSIAGVITATTFIGNGDFVELDVDGHTNLDNVNVVGVTTFNNRIEIDDNTIRDNISAGNNLGIMFSSAGGGAISPTAGNGTLVNGLKDFGENSYRWRNGYFTTLYGDGSNLTGITGTTINNNADNRVITGSGTANTLEGESQLLFTGTNLGVGNRTSSPDERLHVHTSSGQANIHVEGATDGQIILRAHSGDSVIHLGDASATSVGKILYDHGTDSLQFNTNSNERLRIEGNGQIWQNYGRSSSDARFKFDKVDAGSCGTEYYSGGAQKAYIMLDSEENMTYLTQTGSGHRFWTGGSTVRMQIDTNGYVTKPTNPSFAAYRNAGGYTLNNEVFPFDSVRYNKGSHFNTSNYRFTAPVAGRYFFNFHSIYNTGGSSHQIAYRVNNSTSNGMLVHFSHAGGWDYVSYGQMFDLNANDYVTMWSTSNVNWHGGSWQLFCGELLS